MELARGTDGKALREDALHTRGMNLVIGRVVREIPTPRQFEEVAACMTTADLDRTVRVSTSLEQHAEWARALVARRDDLSGTARNARSNGGIVLRPQRKDAP